MRQIVARHTSSGQIKPEGMIFALQNVMALNNGHGDTGLVYQLYGPGTKFRPTHVTRKLTESPIVLGWLSQRKQLMCRDVAALENYVNIKIRDWIMNIL